MSAATSPSRFYHLRPRARGTSSRFSTAHLSYSWRWIAAAATGVAGLAGLMLPERSRRWGLGLAGGASALVGAGALWGWRSIKRLHHTEQTLFLGELPAPFDGLRIAQLSDFHFGPHYARSVAQQALDAVQALQADIIVLTGDFVDTIDDLEPLCTTLAGIQAPLGVYACLGNHDYWNDPALIAQSLDALGIHVLINEHRLLERDTACLALAGVTDPWFGEPDLQQALAGVPSDTPVLLLAHCPDFFDHAAAAGVMLQLSGHTHAGHIDLPLLGPLVLPRLGRRYYRGRYKQRDSALYVNRGLAGLPIRLGTVPEVTLLTLRCG